MTDEELRRELVQFHPVHIFHPACIRIQVYYVLFFFNLFQIFQKFCHLLYFFQIRYIGDRRTNIPYVLKTSNFSDSKVKIFKF